MGSSIVPLETATVSPTYTLPVVAIALFLTNWPTSFVTSLLVKILGTSLWSRSMMLGSAESEHPRLIDRE